MSCLNPPLVRKPSKGFAWQCAFCTRQEVLADSSSSQSPMSNGRDTPPIRPSPDLDHPPSKSELKRQTRATRSQASSISTTKLTIQQLQPTQEIKLKAPKKAPKSKTSMLILFLYILNFDCNCRSTN